MPRPLDFRLAFSSPCSPIAPRGIERPAQRRGRTVERWLARAPF